MAGAVRRRRRRRWPGLRAWQWRQITVSRNPYWNEAARPSPAAVIFHSLNIEAWLRDRDGGR